jgi:Leucine-rich repeat (LRR) protein
MACRLTMLRMPSCSEIAAAILNAGALPPSLTELDLNNCDLEDPDLDALSKLPNLVTLKISANRYLSAPAVVALLAALPSLTSLDLGGIPLVVDERMARALAGMPHLATLVFADGLRQWDFPGGVKFRTLTALDVVGSSAYLPPWVLEEMPALRVLRMSEEDNLNAMKALPPSQLEELQCDKPEDFRDLERRIKRVMRLSKLPGWPYAPKSSGKTELDHVLEIVVGRQRALRRLTLRGHGPDLNPWRLIKYLPPGLTALDLSGNGHGESSLALYLEEIGRALAEACPGLEELAISDYRHPPVLFR